MCLIVVCPPGQTPTLDTIIDATFANPDGSGWCMRVNGGMDWVRSATEVDHVIGSFFQAREQHPDTWAVWHSRLATQGTLIDENTHPFPVPERPWMLVHNGVLPLSDGPLHARHGRCDSRILAEDHVSQMSWQDMRESKAVFEDWLGYDKVVILSERREKGGPCLILNENRGLWEPDDGCWYSHSVEKGLCGFCGARKARCDCYGSYGSWKSTSRKGTSVTTWDDDLDDYEKWWEKADATMPGGEGDHREGDIDCECLDCEELRYWEAKDLEDGTPAMIEQFRAASRLSAIALDNAS